VHPEQLDGAVTKANAILDPAGHFRLVTGAVKPASGQKSIPVSLVHGTFVSDADVAIVADGGCIFVNRDWKSQLSPFFGKDTTGTMDLDPGDALAIILLHEVGHNASLDLLNAFLYARDHPGGILFQRDSSTPYSLFDRKK
jgi:hypothetical protein